MLPSLGFRKRRNHNTGTSIQKEIFIAAILRKPNLIQPLVMANISLNEAPLNRWSEWQLNFLCKTKKKYIMVFRDSYEYEKPPFYALSAGQRTRLWIWETNPHLAKLSERLSRTPCIPLLSSPQWAGSLPARDLSYLRSDCSSCLCLDDLDQEVLLQSTSCTPLGSKQVTGPTYWGKTRPQVNPVIGHNMD